MVAFDEVIGDFLKTELRPRNVYTTVDFVRPLITLYNENFPWITPFMRGDSGFTVVIYVKPNSYVIRLKSNANLQRLTDELHPASASGDVSHSKRADTWIN